MANFRQKLHNTSQGDGLPSSESSTRTPATHLFTCYLGPSIYHWASCWMCSCSAPELEKYSEVIPTVILKSFVQTHV